MGRMMLYLQANKKVGFCCLRPGGSDTTKDFTLQLVIGPITAVRVSSLYK